MKQALEGLYEGLEAIWKTEFPKTCPSCGRLYESMADYMALTIPPASHSGLVDYEGQDHDTQVGLFRNCTCGSTLMAFCRDRRDLSAQGEQRRQIFGNLIEQLAQSGVPAPEARHHLLEALRSGDLAGLNALWDRSGKSSA